MSMNNKRIKVAVQFFGHLRTFEECAESVKNHILNKYDCDVFMHTWDQTDHITKTWHNNRCCITKVDENTVKKLRELYNLKSIEVEKQNLDLFNDSIISCQHNNGQSTISSRGFRFMFYSMQKSNSLRKRFQEKNNVTYDYIIMIRPDIKLYNDFILSEVMREADCLQLSDVRFCATNISGNTECPIIGSMASDILFFASPNTMDNIINS